MEIQVKCKDLDLVCQVDQEDYDRLSKHKWYAYKHGYTYYAFTRINKKIVLMHRFILGVWFKEIEIDHINGVGIDNRKENLRICTHSQNMHNRKTWGKSSYLGVSFNSGINKYGSVIHRDKTRYFLGYYESERIAALAYDLKAKEFYGINAVCNNIVATQEEINLIINYRFKKDNKSSKYKGVVKRGNRYHAIIRYNNKNIIIDTFDNQIDAAKAYNNFIINHSLKRKLNNV